MSRVTAAAWALSPVAAAILAIGLTWLTGFSQRTALPGMVDARFYGFFLDRYPLFAAAIVYGLARLLVATLRPGPSGPVRRVVGGAVAITGLLAACLYPTFGGPTLRAGFATGGMAFLTGQSMAVAYGLGAASAAFVFGLALGLGGLLTAGTFRESGGWGRWLLARGGRVLMRILALWFALAVLGLAHAAGLGAWPRRPLAGWEAGLAAALVLLAFLPHALLSLALLSVAPFSLPGSAGSTAGRRIGHHRSAAG
ncbi:hypothetical protein [Methylobacterium sp. J-090]|uniref:hypothetical protein n=1 Tax=Methylobacterium sp. J-090 TaxID=2836666 RepID=UPI001FB99CCD|nr:hypothetical protein [Methylobacterium sp. J-090]MCJ2082276.1 hypothetical protein [Methylobacterium sp. J-090]